MGGIEICSNQMDEAIAVMREVAAWGRSKGFRVWLDEWLTEEELITPDTRPEDFCVGKVGGATCCAFILQCNDSEYWPDAEKNEAV